MAELSGAGAGIQDVTADPGSPCYIGPIGHDHTSGDEIRAQVTREVDDEGVEIRDHGGAPSSVWDNASHEDMLRVINDNADSAAVTVTSPKSASGSAPRPRVPRSPAASRRSTPRRSTRPRSPTRSSTRGRRSSTSRRCGSRPRGS